MFLSALVQGARGEITQQPAEEYCQSTDFEGHGEHSLVPPPQLGKMC